MFTRMHTYHPHAKDRLKDLVRIFLKPFPRYAGQLLIKSPEPGPPILPTDSLCLNPDFDALMRVLPYNNRVSLTCDQLELDWEVRAYSLGLDDH